MNEYFIDSTSRELTTSADELDLATGEVVLTTWVVETIPAVVAATDVDADDDDDDDDDIVVDNVMVDTRTDCGECRTWPIAPEATVANQP